MSNPKVSVIVPVYGVERYIEECVRSLLNQNYRNLEIILIDDGSFDRCPEICDYFAAADQRVKVLHKNNSGAASARNAGLNAASGEYICFVDSDDSVTSDYIEKLLRALILHNADASVCGYFYHYKTELKKADFKDKKAEVTQIEYLRDFLKDWRCALIWNKLFRKEVIGDVRFAEGHRIDDEFFTYQVIMNCEKIVQIQNSLYMYRMRRSGIMAGSEEYKIQILNDKLGYIQERYKNVIARYPELELPYLAGLADSLIRFKRMVKGWPEGMKEVESAILHWQKKILISKLDIKIKYAFFKNCCIGCCGHAEADTIRLTDNRFFD